MTKKEYKDLEKRALTFLGENLPSYIQYHSVQHTERVIEKAEFIANFLKIKSKELRLLKIAALFHDFGFIHSNINHEERSCEIAREWLEDYNMPNEELELICGMIMATKIPQTTHNHLEEIIADADLEYLGTEDFDRIGTNLYNELLHFNPELTLEQWDKIQIDFIQKHRFFTPYGIEFLEPKKQEHLQRLREKVKD